MDQCKHCEFRGDMKKCIEAECSHHTNWYSVQLKMDLVEKQRKLNQLGDIISGMMMEKDCPNSDNLAIAICTYFSDVYPDDKTESDSGWSYTVDKKYREFIMRLKQEIGTI